MHNGFVQPSFHQGFAHSAGESAYPEFRKGLVAWSPFLGVQGSKLFVFGEARGIDGTLVGMDPSTDWVPGDKGYQLDFDSVNDHIAMGSGQLIDSTKPFTLTIKSKFRGFGTTSNPGFFSFATNLLGGFMGQMASSAGYEPFAFGSRAGQGWAQFRPGRDYASEITGVQSIISIVYDGVSPTAAASFETYLNGIDEGVLTANNLAPHGNTNTIGRNGTGSDYYDGGIDRVYLNRGVAFSEAQIATLHADINAPFRLRAAPLAFIPAAAPAAGIRSMRQLVGVGQGTRD